MGPVKWPNKPTLTQLTGRAALQFQLGPVNQCYGRDLLGFCACSLW